MLLTHTAGFRNYRNKDGLIYREEQISHKTFERYKNRPDKLEYRSVTYSGDDYTAAD